LYQTLKDLTNTFGVINTANMKNILIISSIILLSLNSCKKDKNTTENNTALTEKEKSDLIFLREEEKLAHDVYIHSFNKYNQSIFSNISSSEQSHTNSVLNLLNKYGIDDPSQNKAEGSFQNVTLQQLYNQLIIKSDSSLNKALEVGAIIEDLDISDIKSFYANTSNSDLISTYDKLTCGSRNHFRSFTSQLSSNQITYSAQHLSQAEYNSIIGSANEQCN